MDSEAITKPAAGPHGSGLDSLKTKVGPLPAYAYIIILAGGIVGFTLLKRRSGTSSLPISTGTVSSTGAAGNGNYGSGGGSSGGSAGTTPSPTVTPTVTPTPTPTPVPTTAPSTIAPNGADTRVGITNYWNPDTQRYQQTPYVGATSTPGKKVGDPTGAGGPIIGNPGSGGGKTLAPNGADPRIGITNYWNPTTGRYQQTPVGAASIYPTVGQSGGWQTASGWSRVPNLSPVGPSSPSGYDGGFTPVSSYPVYNPEGGPQ